jgi:hypothetical protein
VRLHVRVNALVSMDHIKQALAREESGYRAMVVWTTFALGSSLVPQFPLHEPVVITPHVNIASGH